MNIIYKNKKPTKENNDLNNKMEIAIKKNEKYFTNYLKEKKSDIYEYKKFFKEGYLKTSINNDYKKIILDDIESKKFIFSYQGTSMYIPSPNVKEIIYKLINDSIYQNVLNELYNGKWHIGTILVHDSTQKCDLFDTILNTHINFCHVDTSDPQSVKIMYYLTDNVNIENGCFQVVPESHKYNNNKEDWIIRKSVKDLGLAHSNKIYELNENYQKSHVFMYDYNENDEYYKEIEKNLVKLESPFNFILFDPNIIHTGGYVYNGTRKALQIVIRKG